MRGVPTWKCGGRGGMHGGFYEVLPIVISVLVDILVNDDVIGLVDVEWCVGGAGTTGNGRWKLLSLKLFIQFLCR